MSGLCYIIFCFYVGGLLVLLVIMLGESVICLELVILYGFLLGLGFEVGVVLSNLSEVFYVKGFI